MSLSCEFERFQEKLQGSPNIIINLRRGEENEDGVMRHVRGGIKRGEYSMRAPRGWEELKLRKSQ
jgi:hypothetical protein